MNHETLEQAATDAYGGHEMCGDVGMFAGINKMQPEDVAKYFHRDGFIAGASWREQQSAKLLAEKDAEIERLKTALLEIRNIDWGTDHCDEKNMIADKALLGE